MGVDPIHAFVSDWRLATVFEKACYALVLAATVANVIRTLRLARLLYAPFERRRRLADLIAVPDAPAEQIARVALVGGLVLDPPNRAVAGLEDGPRVDPQRLRAIQASVDALSREAEAGVAGLRHWTWLTLAIAALAAAQASDGPWASYPGGPSDLTLLGNASDAAIRLIVMLPSSLLMATAWTTLDTALHRRHAGWAYAVAVVRAEPVTGL